MCIRDRREREGLLRGIREAEEEERALRMEELREEAVEQALRKLREGGRLTIQELKLLMEEGLLREGTR